MGLRSWFKKRAKETEHLAEKTGQDIKHTADQAGDAITGTAQDAAKKSERLAREADEKVKGEIMSILDDVKNLANKAKREITDEANKAKREINDEANKAKREIKGGLNQVKAEVQSGVKQVKAEAEKVPGQVKAEIKDIVQELGELASGKVFRAALSAAKTFKSKADELAQKKPQLVKSINKVGFKINLNIVVLKYSDFYSRADEIAAVLTKLAENPPELRRSTITSAIIALAPSETEPGFKIPIFPSGFSFPGMSNDLLAEFIDTALEAAGVPE